jgi:hypothetical protein
MLHGRHDRKSIPWFYAFGKVGANTFPRAVTANAGDH